LYGMSARGRVLGPLLCKYSDQELGKVA